MKRLRSVLIFDGFTVKRSRSMVTIGGFTVKRSRSMVNDERFMGAQSQKIEIAVDELRR